MIWAGTPPNDGMGYAHTVWRCLVCNATGEAKDARAALRAHEKSDAHLAAHAAEQERNCPLATAVLVELHACVSGFEYDWDDDAAIEILRRLTGEVGQ